MKLNVAIFRKRQKFNFFIHIVGQNNNDMGTLFKIVDE